MNKFVSALFSAILFALSFSAFAETPEEWLAKPAFGIDFKGRTYSNVFSVDKKGLTIVFNGSSDPCGRGKIPIDLKADGDNVIVTVKPEISYCPQLRYVLNTVYPEKSVVQTSPDKGATWTDGTAKVKIVP